MAVRRTELVRCRTSIMRRCVTKCFPSFHQGADTFCSPYTVVHIGRARCQMPGKDAAVLLVPKPAINRSLAAGCRPTSLNSTCVRQSRAWGTRTFRPKHGADLNDTHLLLSNFWTWNGTHKTPFSYASTLLLSSSIWIRRVAQLCGMMFSEAFAPRISGVDYHGFFLISSRALFPRATWECVSCAVFSTKLSATKISFNCGPIRNRHKQSRKRSWAICCFITICRRYRYLLLFPEHCRHRTPTSGL
jgi:hypothetical protein